MPEPIPPILNPFDDFDMESALHRADHALIALRHREIPRELIDDQIENDDALRLEYDDIFNQLSNPTKQPRHSVGLWFINFGQRGGHTES